MIFEKRLDRCRACHMWFLPVDWLPWRTRGYCCAACEPAVMSPPKGRKGVTDKMSESVH